jgi:hypothetical protein
MVPNESTTTAAAICDRTMAHDGLRTQQRLKDDVATIERY